METDLHGLIKLITTAGTQKIIRSLCSRSAEVCCDDARCAALASTAVPSAASPGSAHRTGPVVTQVPELPLPVSWQGRQTHGTNIYK